MYTANPEQGKIRVAVICWFLTLGYMGIIFYLSSHQSFDLPELPENFDKVVHMGIYFLLAFLLYLSLKRSGIKKYVFVTAFLLAGFYGITDELHQAFVPGRDAAIGDIFADFIGAFLGCFGASFLRA